MSNFDNNQEYDSLDNNENVEYGYQYNDFETSDEELERLKAQRKERYTDERYQSFNSNRGSSKKISKPAVITIIIIIFVYYITLLILRSINVINVWILLGCSFAGVIVMLIAYAINNKK